MSTFIIRLAYSLEITVFKVFRFSYLFHPKGIAVKHSGQSFIISREVNLLKSEIVCKIDKTV